MRLEPRITIPWRPSARQRGLAFRSHIRDKSIWLSRKADRQMKFHLPIAMGLNARRWVCNPVTLGLRSLPKLVATDIAV